MILLFFYVFQVSSNIQNRLSTNTTFCVCLDRKNISCSDVCKNFPIIGYNRKEILKVTKKYNESKITFKVYGTTNSKKPEFDLSEYMNISLNIVSGTRKTENIILNGIDKNNDYYNFNEEKLYRINHNQMNEDQDITNEKYSHFSNLNIYFHNGKYLFNHLIMYETFFVPSSDSSLSKKTTILQNFLTSDFTSFSNIPNQIKYVSPTHRFQIICNESVNNIYFLENHQVILQMNESFYNCSVDLRNLKKSIRANIILVSRNLQLTFQFMPTNEDEIPKIDFKLKKSAKIFIDTNKKQFDDKLMKIGNIRFIHGSASIYFFSDKDINIPTFDEEGVGTVYKNDEISFFTNTYCICEGKECSTKCGDYRNNIIPFDIHSIDKTVVGNPYKTVKYVISNSQEEEGKHPIFDLEHFGDKNLTVIGMTKSEHIEFIGDGTDDVGVFSFTNVIFHGNHLLFPEVFLHDVRIAKSNNQKEIILNATLLKSDVSTLKNIFNSNVSIIEPVNGYEIHTTNILNQISLLIMKSKKIKIDDSLILSYSRKTMIKIFGSGIVNIFLQQDQQELHQKLNSLPNLRIYLEGDRNVVTFPGNQWPELLKDISSKLTLIHGENDVYVNGDTEYGKNPENPKYNTIPPIVDHEGTGAFFINGKLNNYADKYCICEPIEEITIKDDSDEQRKLFDNNCEYLCQDYGPVTGFSANEIEDKAIGNPIRSIQYFIIQSSKNKHPTFDLIKFSDKSFSITGVGPEKQYISLIGTNMPKFTSTSISHVFQNICIEFSSLGFYFFNNVIINNCSFYENIINANNETNKNENNMIHLKNSIKIYHSGMTIDMSSLKSIYSISNQIIYPSKNYLQIEGLNELKGFSIDSSRYISLYDNQEMNKGISIDLSMLSSPIQLSTSFGNSIENPFLVFIKDDAFKNVEEIPNIFIDVSGIPDSDSYIMFDGRKKWDNEFHNLKHKITVFYGQTNIHLITKEVNSKRELPPHVNLVGDGEYYINNEKQGSVFAPGDSIASDDDTIDNNGWSFASTLLVILLISAVLFLVYFVYKKVKKSRHEQTFFDRWKDEAKRLISESDLSLSHFEIDLDDVNMSE